jgi:hypothetical protein
MPFSGFYVCSGCKPLAVGKISRGEPVGTIWRDRKRLVVVRDGAFPDRCIRCNGAANGSGVRRTYYWHHPAIYLLVFIFILLYVLVAVATRKRSKAYIPLCERHRKRRTMGILICSAVFIAGLIGLFGAFSMLNAGDWVIGIIFASLTAILGSMIAAAVVTRLLQPIRITETHAIYTGAGAAFLNGLPNWPGA